MITPDNANIPDNKILGYALNKEHPKGKDKAIALEMALGYNKDNYKDLIKAVKDNLNNYPAIPKGESKYGKLYKVSMMITGPDGKTAKVKTGWIIDKGSDIPRLTTFYVD
ncbi:MAG TPA: hypothetical protein GXX35_03700 [Thermoanaerobacterales bacterium]|nr:hypothetical protein [Thermoanaerobacterales bacterium]